MAFYAGKDLKTLILRERIILDENGLLIADTKRVKQAAYELSLGGEVYCTDNKNECSEILNNKSKNVTINPGQFCLLLTDEVVNIPKNKLAFISIKAGVKLKGLINVSGFHVDPGYKGKLLFSVYNASPSKITLQYKEQYFLIWFADLKNEIDQNGSYNDKGNHFNQLSIKPDYIDALKNGEMVSPHAINKKVNKFKNKQEKDNQKSSLEKKRLLWAFVILITLGISSNIAYWNKENEFDKGYQKKHIELEYSNLRDQITNLKNDSLYLRKLDSIIEHKLKDRYVER